jgi:hypothetical protein
VRDASHRVPARADRNERFVVRAALRRKQLSEIGARMIALRKTAPRHPAQPSALKKAADALLS